MLTMQRLLTLQAVVETGSFQAAARRLHKTHPSVISGLKQLEDYLGFSVFDRSQYRATLTHEGRVFYERSLRVLREMASLQAHADHIAQQHETELNIVLGDVTPTRPVLALLKQFFARYPNTQLNLLFENIGGPQERLLNGQADIIVHHIDKADKRYVFYDFSRTEMVPVAAPGFMPLGRLSNRILQNYTQCVIRDTAQVIAKKDYLLIPGAPNISVGDQYTKKDVIKQGLGWGHMPRFLIEDELQQGALVALAVQGLPSHFVEIVVARRAEGVAGHVAAALWQFLAQSAAEVAP